MPWFEAVRLALKTIRAQKLKSFFSLVGVLIGTTFLVAGWAIFSNRLTVTVTAP